MSQGLDHSLKNNGGKSLLVDYNLLTSGKFPKIIFSVNYKLVLGNP